MGRGTLGFILGAVGLLIAVPIGWWVAGRGEAPVTAALPIDSPLFDAGVADLPAVLGGFAGEVELRHGQGEWRKAQKGELVQPSDRLRTKDGSWAVVVGGEAWEVRMESGTEVELSELSHSISKILLESGLAKATVRGAARHTFEVRAANSDAVATTQSGAFTVATNGQGTVALGTQDGEVQFSGKGRVVIVRAGQQSLIRPGQAPSAPAPVPSSLFLKVALPARAQVNTRKLKVLGQSEPGALVEVAGRVVNVGADGKFETLLPLDEGKNAIEVRARSVGQKDARSSHAIELDTRVRKTTVDKDLWGPKP